MGKKKKSTVGYRYYLGMLSAICQGRIDRITHVYWDEDLAWSGDWFSGQITIDKPSLFGGDDKEGGVSGVFELLPGDQLTQNDYLVGQLGADNVSAFYGTACIVTRQAYLGNSPYLKAMSVVVHSGEVQYPGMPQWNIADLKIPCDTVFGNYQSSTLDVPDDSAVREGLDVWVVYSTSEHTADGRGLTDFAESVRDAINLRFSQFEAPVTPQSKQIGLGFAYGGYSMFRIGGREGYSESRTNSATVVGDTLTAASFATWNTFNLSGTALGTTISSTGFTWPYLFGSYSAESGDSYVRSAIGAIGRDTSRLSTFRHGVILYLGSRLTAADFSAIASRYTAAGGTFQLHTMRPVDFRRTKAPYDFFQTRVNTHVRRILENDYPDGSNTSTIAFNDGVQLNSTAEDADRPSTIGDDVNPVHILRECITSPIVGLGEPEDSVDDSLARYAAALLKEEGFGISLSWSDESSVNEFMQLVCDHANITTYVSNRTGLWKIRPIRGDYDKDTIPVISIETDIVEVDSLTRRLPSEGINAVTVKYYDIDRDDTASIPVYNTAAIQQRGGVIDATTVYYDGILREDLAYAVGERDLLTLGYPLVTGAIYLDRRYHYFEPGDVFWLNAPSHGVMNEVMRVVDVDYGSDDDLRIRVDLSSDIYSLEPQPMDRGEPYVPSPVSQPPVPMTRRFVVEAPYYLAAQELGIAAVNAALANDPDSGGLYACGPSPASSLASAQIWSTFADEGMWSQVGGMEFSPTVVLSEYLSADPTDTVIHYAVSWSPEDFEEGDVAFLDDEIVRIDAIDTVAKTVTVARGVFDTVPLEHDSGGMLCLVEGFGGFIDDNYTADMSFDVALLPYSGNSLLPLASAPVDRVVLDSRLIRPYPAADVKVNGTYEYTLLEWDGTLDLTWVHRNRRQQQHVPQGFTEAGLSPEPGLTYTLRVNAWTLDGTKLPVVFEENLGLVTSTSIDLTAHALPDSAAKASVEIIAIRDGYENWTNIVIAYYVPYTMGMGFATMWWDANLPVYMRQTATKVGNILASGDPVRHIDNVASLLPGWVDPDPTPVDPEPEPEPPPTDPYWANVIFYAPLTSTLADVSSAAKAVTSTGAAINIIADTPAAGLGANSVRLGSGSYLTIALNALFGAGNFTIEFFIKRTGTTGSNYDGYFSIEAGVGLDWALFTLTKTTSLVGNVWCSSNASAWNVLSLSALGAVLDGNWHHVAVTRDGGTLRTFLDGAVISTVSVTTGAFTQRGPNMYIGAKGDNLPGATDAAFQHVRVTKGVARYTAAFTPPTEPFPTQ